MKLIGNNGSIQITGDVGTAIITNPILEKRYGAIKQFNVEELDKWIQRLKIYSTEDGSIKIGSWK